MTLPYGLSSSLIPCSLPCMGGGPPELWFSPLVPPSSLTPTTPIATCQCQGESKGLPPTWNNTPHIISVQETATKEGDDDNKTWKEGTLTSFYFQHVEDSPKDEMGLWGVSCPEDTALMCQLNQNLVVAVPQDEPFVWWRGEYHVPNNDDMKQETSREEENETKQAAIYQYVSLSDEPQVLSGFGTGMDLAPKPKPVDLLVADSHQASWIVKANSLHGWSSYYINVGHEERFNPSAVSENWQGCDSCAKEIMEYKQETGVCFPDAVPLFVQQQQNKKTRQQRQEQEQSVKRRAQFQGSPFGLGFQQNNNETEMEELFCDSQNVGQLATAGGTVWYKFSPPSDVAEVVISTCSSITSFDTMIGTATSSREILSENDDHPGCVNYQSRLVVRGSELNFMNEIFVKGYGVETGSFALNIACILPIPSASPTTFPPSVSPTTHAPTAKPTQPLVATCGSVIRGTIASRGARNTYPFVPPRAPYGYSMTVHTCSDYTDFDTVLSVDTVFGFPFRTNDDSNKCSNFQSLVKLGRGATPYANQFTVRAYRQNLVGGNYQLQIDCNIFTPRPTNAPTSYPTLSEEPSLSNEPSVEVSDAPSFISSEFPSMYPSDVDSPADEED